MLEGLELFVLCVCVCVLMKSYTGRCTQQGADGVNLILNMSRMLWLLLIGRLATNWQIFCSRERKRNESTDDKLSLPVCEQEAARG